MRFLRLFLIPAVLLVSLGAAGSAQACAFCGLNMYQIVNVKNWASLRATPSTKAQRLVKVPRDETVVANGPTHQTIYHEWIQVHYDGRTGWIPTDYLQFIGVVGDPGVNSPQPPAGYDNATSCGGIVRSRPSMNSRRVTSLRQGKRIEILAPSGVWMNGYEWYRIAFDGRNGYQWGGILSADDQRQGSYIGC